jgi:hypothetical protein
MVKKAYDKAFVMPKDDKLIVDCFMAILTATIYKELNESVWMYWIAPPGSGKTLAVSPVQGHPLVLMLSTPTENALMSGYTDEDGSDPSLMKLLDGMVLIWKDFTALMYAGDRIVNKISGEFRDCYDGTSSKASGRAGIREYEARFGMIACVTDEIDAFTETHQQLGERFLSFRMNRVKLSHAQRIRGLRTITKSMGKKKEWLEQLKKIVHVNIDRINLASEKMKIPTLSAGALEEVEIMADLLALARTSCGDTANSAEMGNRIVQQLINLGHAHALADFRTAWNESEMVLIRRVMIDSLASNRKRLFAFLFKQGKHRPAKSLAMLAKKSGTTEKAMKKIIKQYVYSGILETAEGGNPDESWYRLSKDIYESIEKVGVLA